MIASIVLPRPGLDNEKMLLSPYYVSIAGAVSTAPRRLDNTSDFSSFQVMASEYLGKTRTDVSVTCLYETNAKQFKAKLPGVQVGYPIAVWGNVRDGHEGVFDMALTELHTWSTAELRQLIERATTNDVGDTTNSMFDDIFARIEQERAHKLSSTADISSDSSTLTMKTENTVINEEVLNDTRKSKRKRASPVPSSPQITKFRTRNKTRGKPWSYPLPKNSPVKSPLTSLII